MHIQRPALAARHVPGTSHGCRCKGYPPRRIFPHLCAKKISSRLSCPNLKAPLIHMIFRDQKCHTSGIPFAASSPGPSGIAPRYPRVCRTVKRVAGLQMTMAPRHLQQQEARVRCGTPNQAGQAAISWRGGGVRRWLCHHLVTLARRVHRCRRPVAGPSLDLDSDHRCPVSAPRRRAFQRRPSGSVLMHTTRGSTFPGPPPPLFRTPGKAPAAVTRKSESPNHRDT